MFVEEAVTLSETSATETVDYGATAVNEVKDLVNQVDFSVFITMMVAVVGATIGINVGITALKKGVAWIKLAIRRAGQ